MLYMVQNLLDTWTSTVSLILIFTDDKHIVTTPPSTPLTKKPTMPPTKDPVTPVVKPVQGKDIPFIVHGITVDVYIYHRHLCTVQ